MNVEVFKCSCGKVHVKEGKYISPPICTCGSDIMYKMIVQKQVSDHDIQQYIDNHLTSRTIYTVDGTEQMYYGKDLIKIAKWMRDKPTK